MLLQHHNFRIYEAHQILQNNDIDVYTIKTDAFTVKPSDLEKCQELLNFGSDIGLWRHSKTGDDINLPTKPIQKIECQSIQIPETIVNNIPVTIEQEYDTEYICKNIIEKNNRTLIRAKYAGSGKSYICEYMEKLVIKFSSYVRRMNLRRNIRTVAL